MKIRIISGIVTIELDEVDSSNSYLKDMISKTSPNYEIAILAYNQTKGRGQFGNQWKADPNKNLTFSYLYFPEKLAAIDQFIISKSISVAILKGLQQCLSKFNIPIDELNLKIKWPNDIYLNNKKIGGILIENSISSNKIENSIIGIGINVLQTEFGELNKKATSLFKELNIELNIFEIMEKILDAFTKYRLQKSNVLDKLYLDNLYKFNEIHNYCANDVFFKGKIIGIDNFGKLQVENIDQQTTNSYWLKEIEFIHD